MEMNDVEEAIPSIFHTKRIYMRYSIETPYATIQVYEEEDHIPRIEDENYDDLPPLESDRSRTTIKQSI